LRTGSWNSFRLRRLFSLEVGESVNAEDQETHPRVMAFRKTTLAALLALLGLGMLPVSDQAQARLGLGGGIGVGGWGSGVGFGGYRFGADAAVRAGYGGYHPVYGAGVRAGVGVTAAGADFYARPYAGFHPAWGNGGYWGARPWSAGWYQVNPAAWDWWGPSAAAWGLSGLATGAAITALVNQAAAQQSVVITVPQTSYTLNYASVEAVGSQGASFFYNVDGGPQLFGGANCAAGLVDGQPPASAAEAQLLNAVCQVAYGAAA
jgi:hypothetical protein